MDWFVLGFTVRLTFFFWLYGAETEARRGDDPTLTSETRQGIFKVRLPKDSLTHYHAFITQSGCTGGKRQERFEELLELAIPS